MKIITIIVKGGCVMDVVNLPAGLDYEVEDLDNPEEEPIIRDDWGDLGDWQADEEKIERGMK